MPPENRTVSDKVHEFAGDENDNGSEEESGGGAESSSNSSNSSFVIVSDGSSSCSTSIPYIGDVVQTDSNEVLLRGEEGSGAKSNGDGENDDDNDAGNAPPLRRRSSTAAAAALLAASAVYAREKRRQERLTKPPLVLGQVPPNTVVRSVWERLTQSKSESNPDDDEDSDSTGTDEDDCYGNWNRPIVPSLFVGTRGSLASVAAHLSRGPSVSAERVLRFSEQFRSSHDGAVLDLIWEVPDRHPGEGRRRKRAIQGSASSRSVPGQQRHRIEHPTAVILHGINHSSEKGCVRSLQRTLTDKGWNAVAVNLRGCGPDSALSTPRSYTAAYTGDLRSLVRQLSARCAAPAPQWTGDTQQLQLQPQPPQKHSPLLLVGSSLGANLLTKYLGEEGLAGTLPAAVRAGVALANPFGVRSDNMRFPYSLLIGGARKAHYRRHRKTLESSLLPANTVRSVVSDPRVTTLSALDTALAPHLVRNAAHPPYETRIGYGHRENDCDCDCDDRDRSEATATTATTTPEDHYWDDSTSFRQGRHVSVPFLHVQARDDSLCFSKARHYLGHTLQNPNVLWVETECGGHLGWWSSSANNNSNRERGNENGWPGTSWAHDATADFFRAVLESENDDLHRDRGESTCSPAPIDDAQAIFARNSNSNHGRGDETERNTVGTSERCLAGDDTDNSTIRSDESIASILDSAESIRPPARIIHHNGGDDRFRIVSQRVGFRIQLHLRQYLRVRLRNGVRNEEQLEGIKLLERDESIQWSRRLRSRL